MKKIVGLKEFRNNVDVWIKHVNHGNSLLVFKRSKAVFKIVPPEEELWEPIFMADEFIPTISQKKALSKAEKNLKDGKTLSIDDAIRKLVDKN